MGDFHLPYSASGSINEKWLLHPKGGVVGFIASTSAGFASPLHNWSNTFFRRFLNPEYHQSLGNIMKATISEIQGQSDFVKRACMEMNLHGDPSLKFYQKTKPDFAVRQSDFSAPSFVSIDVGTVDLSYTIYNLGIAVDTLIPVQIKRVYPSGKDTTYLDTIKGINYSISNVLTVYISNEKSVGENRFILSIDPDNSIDEIYPTVNNSTTEIKVNVTSDDLIPIYPSNYSIQPNSEFTLSASTADPNAPSRTYKFEIDNNDSFNGSQKKTGIVVSTGGLVQWNPKLTAVKDSTVFFWRCTPFDENLNNNKWREFSFQYIPTQTGWSQFDFSQFKNNSFNNLDYDKGNKLFKFGKGKANIQCFNRGNPSSISEYSSIKWSINGNQEGRNSICRGFPSIFISVIDPRTMVSWETRMLDGTNIINPDNNFGNVNDYSKGVCPQGDRRFQFLVSDSNMMDSMIWMINNVIPDSFYVLVSSASNAHFQNSNYWKNRHYQAFEDLGADSIRSLNNDLPYILFAQKGNKSKVIEVIGSHPNDGISLNAFITSNLNEASMKSVQIHNSSNYKSLFWNYLAPEREDSIAVSLYGKDKSGQQIELLKINDNNFSIPDLKALIPNINQMKDLEMVATFKDSLAHNAPQLKHWMLLSDEPLELALDPSYFFEFSKDSLMQGEELKLKIGLKNLSHTNADSITIRFTILNLSLGQPEAVLLKTAPLIARDSLIIKFTHSTDNMTGSYSLFIDVNPEDTLWQPEGYHFNNVSLFNFYVKADKTNPLLDVTFDGVHILDGDIVSAKPEILISLNDENKFKPIIDTSGFELYLTDPISNKKRVYFSNSNTDYEIEFIPENGDKNKAEIRFLPHLTTDGDYSLEVEAKDASNNRSGSNKYKVSFEIINKSSVTEILNYPNPFSTSTKFVFTLTGYEVPDYFRIQILTPTGRVVREIDRDELGALQIGRNITDYAWNGKDQFGDQLANGVYFYRVIIKINGEEMEKRNTAADSYFKKGFGKMYLLR